MTRIILATANVAYEDMVRNAFAPPLNGSLSRVDAVPGTLDDEHLDEGAEVVAFGPDYDLEAALEIARRLDIERPEITTVLISAPTTDLLEKALRAGVREVLAPDATGPDIVTAFERASDVARRRRSSLGGDAEHEGPERRIITVISPKGGSGKTTTCTNLAVGLAQAAPGDVVLVDLDLQFGDAASALQLEPESTMVDIARAPMVEPAAVKVALTSHESGLYVLCAPESPADAESVTAEHVAATLAILADQFRYVVVDTDAGLSEHSLTAIELATDLICVCSMDVPSVRSLRKELIAIDQLNLTKARRHFVLNRADTRVGIEAQDIETTVQLHIDISVPSSRAVPLSLNQGSPLVVSDPRSPVARQFMALVGRFIEQPATQSGGLLRRRRSAR
jgi:pilus assembly protein CpaE